MDDNRLEIPTPFGPAKARGKEVFPWALIAILVAGVGWFVTQTFSLHHAIMLETHTAMSQTTDELAYTVAVCMNPDRKDDCRKLSNRDMPESLRKKVRSN